MTPSSLNAGMPFGSMLHSSSSCLVLMTLGRLLNNSELESSSSFKLDASPEQDNSKQLGVSKISRYFQLICKIGLTGTRRKSILLKRKFLYSLSTCSTWLRSQVEQMAHSICVDLQIFQIFPSSFHLRFGVRMPTPATAMVVAEIGPGKEIVGFIRGCIKTVASPVYTNSAYILGLRVSPTHRLWLFDNANTLVKCRPIILPGNPGLRKSRRVAVSDLPDQVSQEVRL
eukprot:Gb_03941 [translate_table: standard]